MDLVIECKRRPTEQDPFDDDATHNEPMSDLRQEALGQILSYAELVFRYQQRTCVFMLLFLGDCARLLRVDRSGLFATKKFQYAADGGKTLGELLYRYFKLPDEDRGHDPTATRIEKSTNLWKAMKKLAEREASDDYVLEMFQKSLSEKWTWWVLEVPVEQTKYQSKSSVRKRRFAVAEPNFYAGGVAGRGTRGYVAIEVTPSNTIMDGVKFVYLKDAWRVYDDDINKEGNILRTLNDKGVPYIPTLVCHGDLHEQMTKSQKLWAKYHPSAEPGQCPLKTHQHYRLVVEEVGKRLDYIQEASELITALCCAIIGTSCFVTIYVSVL